MWKIRIGIGACCLAALLAAACASAPASAAAAGVEKLHGTWVNQEYFGTYWTHTVVLYPDGRHALFQKNDTESPTEEGRYTVDKNWVGADGSLWYRLTWRTSYAPYNEEVAAANKAYSLVRIDPSGASFEIESSKMTWAGEFGALGGTHFIYYRR